MTSYFILGYQHITDINAYDHMLFIALLIHPFQLREWKKIVGLLTAFTVGHSITLAFSVVGWQFLDIKWVEFLIPITILFTGLLNLSNPKKRPNHYVLTSVFGLIHGMGFAGYLTALLPTGSIWEPLLYFNLGVEAGQIIFATILVLLLFLISKYAPFKTLRTVRMTINITGIAISLFLASQNWPI